MLGRLARKLSFGVVQPPTLLIDGQVLANADIEGVAVALHDSIRECPQAGRTHAGILVDKEANLAGVAEQLLQMQTVTVQSVFGVDLHARCREPLSVGEYLGRFDIRSLRRYCVGGGDRAVKIAASATGGGQ